MEDSAEAHRHRLRLSFLGPGTPMRRMFTDARRDLFVGRLSNVKTLLITSGYVALWCGTRWKYGPPRALCTTRLRSSERIELTIKHVHDVFLKSKCWGRGA
jgi:hypothetical protein